VEKLFLRSMIIEVRLPQGRGRLTSGWGGDDQ